MRAFTLESGQQEIERQNQRRKADGGSSDGLTSPRLSQSVDDLRASSGVRSPLSHIPEEGGPFAIGGDDSDEEAEAQDTPSQSSPSVQNSRTPSISSTADDSVPLQLRGMSEKARGKMPAGATFSRQNSTTSLSSYTGPITSASAGFTPTAGWVSFSWHLQLVASC